MYCNSAIQCTTGIVRVVHYSLTFHRPDENFSSYVEKKNLLVGTPFLVWQIYSKAKVFLSYEKVNCDLMGKVRLRFPAIPVCYLFIF